MLNHEQIKHALSDAEQSFKSCWSKLVTIRNAESNKSDMMNSMLTFQPTLGVALYKLASHYNAVCKEARDLVGNKSKLNRKSVRCRIHSLDRSKLMLQEALDVGKALGDSFAWIFYRGNHGLLRKHYEQQSNPHPPTWAGGSESDHGF